MSDETLANLAHEERRFEPPADLAANANLTAEAYAEADADRLGFWEKQAERLHWDTKWSQVLDWEDAPFAKWFVGGKINAAYNCVDRHVEAGAGDKVAFHWVGEPEGESRDITYAQLKDEVCKAANALVELGVKTGDRVAIYMPMIPETVVTMLACARLGAPAHRGLRRLLRRRAGQPHRGLRRAGRGHLRRRLPSRRPLRSQARRRRGLHQERRGPQGARGTPHRPGRRVERRARRLVARHRRAPVDRARVRVLRRRAPALRHVHLRHDRQAEGDPAHHRRLPGRVGVHPLGHLRPEAGDRRLLVHRRHRLGDRAQLHGLRPTGEPDHVGDVRRHAGQPAQGPLVGDHPAVRRHHLLHRAHGDPDVHEVGRRHPREVRPVLAPRPRVGRRADQPGGLRLVPQDHRRRPRADRRHLVADRDRRDHDQPAARRDRGQARARR